MSEPVEEKRPLEEVLDEVLSFNYRSLRTLRDIFLRPGHVAQTFASGDRDTYTPTMRVWFCVMSWLFILSIIWGGFGAVILRASAANGDLLGQFIVEGRRDLEAVTDAVSTLAAILFVPVSAFFTLLGPPFLRQFNLGLTKLQSIQCYFIPVTAMAVSSTIFLTASAWDSRALNFAPFVNYSVFFLFAFQIMRPVFADSIKGAIIKSLGLMLVVMFLTMLSTILTLVTSIIYALIAVPPISG
ncbi:MAG: DUF3667 domain-containing protein [Maricaulis sp.]|jgi:hypothetical protein|nr:DUF3667 domain-containing protein [Maricaulis sp.]